MIDTFIVYENHKNMNINKVGGRVKKKRGRTFPFLTRINVFPMFLLLHCFFECFCHFRLIPIPIFLGIKSSTISVILLTSPCYPMFIANLRQHPKKKGLFSWLGIYIYGSKWPKVKGPTYPKNPLVNHVLFHLNIAIFIGDMFLPHSQTDPKKTHCVVAYIPITVYPHKKKKKNLQNNIHLETRKKPFLTWYLRSRVLS